MKLSVQKSRKTEAMRLIKRIRAQIWLAQKHVDELAEMVDELMPTEEAEFKCPVCAFRFRSVTMFQEHVYRHHDGPVPDHYVAAEKAADG